MSRLSLPSRPYARFCNRNMRTLAISVLALLIAVGAPLSAVAQGGNQNQSPGGNPAVRLVNPLSAGNCNSANTDCLGNFLISILQFVVRIGSIVVILMLVFVGFKFVVAQGNEAKITEAKTMLLWTLIGALVLLGAQVIALGIQATVRALTG